LNVLVSVFPTLTFLLLLSDVKWVGPSFFPRFLACFCSGLGTISLNADVFLEAHHTHNGSEQTDAVVGRLAGIADCFRVSETGLQDSRHLK
jgi:hypothetical protein